MTHSLYTPTSVFALLRFITKYLARRGSSKPSQPPADDSDNDSDLVRLRRGSCSATKTTRDLFIGLKLHELEKNMGCRMQRFGGVVSHHGIT